MLRRVTGNAAKPACYATAVRGLSRVLFSRVVGQGQVFTVPYGLFGKPYPGLKQDRPIVPKRQLITEQLAIGIHEIGLLVWQQCAGVGRLAYLAQSDGRVCKRVDRPICWLALFERFADTADLVGVGHFKN